MQHRSLGPKVRLPAAQLEQFALPQFDACPNRAKDSAIRQRHYYLEERALPATRSRNSAPLSVGMLAIENGELRVRDSFTPEFCAEKMAQSMRSVRTLVEVSCGIFNAPPAKIARTLAWDLWTTPKNSLGYSDLQSPICRPRSMDRARAGDRAQIRLVGEGQRFFTEDRLWGMNPLILRRVPETAQWPHHWQRSDVQRLLTVDVDQLQRAGRLYVFDPSSLIRQAPDAPAETGKRRWCPRPTLLLQRKGDGAGAHLIPLAIRIDTSPCLAHGVVIPAPECSKQGDTRTARELWSIARVCLGVADCNLFESHFHLGHFHFWTEAVYVATERCLHARHPLGALLREHLSGVSANNRLGGQLLLNQHGPLDRLMGLSLRGVISITKRSVQEFKLLDSRPPVDLANRGLTQDGAWNHYVRWAMSIWEAIEAFAGQWVDTYYGSGEAGDRGVVGDNELQSWCQWLARHRGQAGGIPARLQTAAQVRDILAALLYHTSAGHSIVNYAQWESLGCIPAMPLALYADYRQFFARVAKRRPSLREVKAFHREMLPNRVRALEQTLVVSELTSHRPGRLGQYSFEPEKPQAKQAIADFQQRLADIDAEVEAASQRMAAEEGRERGRPFDHLAPKSMTNSPCV